MKLRKKGLKDKKIKIKMRPPGKVGSMKRLC